MTKPAEPFPVQPDAWWCVRSILVRHHYRDGGLWVVRVERAASGNEFHQTSGAVVVADIPPGGHLPVTGGLLGPCPNPSGMEGIFPVLVGIFPALLRFLPPGIVPV